MSSLRAPGSYIDFANPEAVLYDRMFKGSGTSQSAAAVSGAAALILQQRPTLTPDQVKKILVKSATRLPVADPVAQGAGIINMKAAVSAPASSYTVSASAQSFTRSTGLGSLDESRGTARMADEGVELRGEIDIMGTPWDANTWAKNALGEVTWVGGLWNGVEWSGDGWTGSSWAGRTWSGRTWSGRTWSGRTWSSIDYSGRTWSGRTWSGEEWAGRTWSGRTWSGRTWSGRTWSNAGWGDQS